MSKKSAAAAKTRITPMMQQFMEIKAANADCLLFYRMGDFYELFFEDAVKASAALGIVLTKRGKHLGEDVQMCGVPVIRADEYLHKLIRAGFKVAVCEQTQDPAEAKKLKQKVVRREVTRLVTSGTITEDSLLEQRRNNYLVALHEVKAAPREQAMAIAFADISTGEFGMRTTGRLELPSDLARLEASEILLSDALLQDLKAEGVFSRISANIVPLPLSKFDSANAEQRLKTYFAVKALEAYGDFTRAELGAAGALLDYIEMTQIGAMPRLNTPRRESSGSTMRIDAATRANLELAVTMQGKRQGSLLDIIDMTLTGGGGREIAARLMAPLTNPAAINARLGEVDFFVENQDLQAGIRKILKSCPELARSVSRLSLDRGGPRDLLAIRGALQSAIAVKELFKSQDDTLIKRPENIELALAALDRAEGELLHQLESMLGDEAPLTARDGGFVREGYSPELDELRALRDESRRVIAAMQAQYAQETAIKSLKIRHNNVLGYFIEVTSQHGDKLLCEPFDALFIHRQTLASAVRFTTVELNETQSRIHRAAEQALSLELEIFNQLSASIGDNSEMLGALAAALADIDVAAALAMLAEQCNLTRPQIDESCAFHLEGARHLVVEKALADQGQNFIANDCDLNPEDEERGRIWLLTGPNMAGKSTFLRQNALIAILGQMGSFVPAKTARIGIIDQLFSRVGAADDLARGRSTFMVEMVETAVILNQAGSRALVILDEIGRGTSTFDGLSIAWACVEHLHAKNKCRALFATHFHELTALAKKLDHLFNVTMKVKEWKGEVVFLHEVAPGAADRSYGLAVAKLAGLPPAVISRAGEVLAALEKSEQHKSASNLVDDLPLFSALRPDAAKPAAAQSKAEAALREALPDNMSPREALDFVYQLKKLLSEE